MMRTAARFVQLYVVAALLIGLCVSVLAPAAALAQSALQGLPHRTAPDTSTSLGAHARFSKAPINMGLPNLQLAVALTAAGGGEPAFDAAKFIAELTGSGSATQSELAALTKKFGAANVASFEKTFDFFTRDARAQAAQAGIALPSPPVALDAKTLAAQLYDAGLTPSRKYDVEYMLDSLVSHIVNVAVMNDIDADPDLGPAADANYHLVFAQLMQDVKTLHGLPATGSNSMP